MFRFLDKVFVKDYDKPELPQVRERYGVLSSVLGVVVNVMVAAMKLILGVIIGSIAVIADAVNNFSDAGASIVSFVSFKIAAKPADRDHPFGHARIEYVCSMIVSFLILLVGFELVSESITGLLNPKEASGDLPIAMYVILGISIIAKLFLAAYYKRVGKMIDSSVITASAADSVMDAFSTTAVLVSGVVVQLTGLAFIDSLVGIAVSVMIFIAGLRILNDTKNSLLGEPPMAKMVDDIKAIVAKHDYVVGIHDLIVHNYGPGHYIASFHAEVDGSKDIYLIHDAIDNLEREINSELGVLCTVHMDPIETDNEEVVRLRAITCDLVERMYPGAGVHDFRVVSGPTHTNLIFDIALPFEIEEDNKLVIERVNSEIKNIDQSYFTVITIDRE